MIHNYRNGEIFGCDVTPSHFWSMFIQHPMHSEKFHQLSTYRHWIEQNPIYIFQRTQKSGIIQWLKSRQRVSEREKGRWGDFEKPFCAHSLTHLTGPLPSLKYQQWKLRLRWRQPHTPSHKQISTIFHLNIFLLLSLHHIALKFSAHHVHLFLRGWCLFFRRVRDGKIGCYGMEKHHLKSTISETLTSHRTERVELR